MENTVKRPATIDFNRPCRYARPAPSLVTPILALSTPELTKMISGEELAVLTPNGISSVIPQANNNNSNNVIKNVNLEMSVLHNNDLLMWCTNHLLPHNILFRRSFIPFQ